jgi:hypothetical protein
MPAKAMLARPSIPKCHLEPLGEAGVVIEQREKGCRNRRVRDCQPMDNGDASPGDNAEAGTIPHSVLTGFPRLLD